MRELGRRSTGPGTIYLTGGATALLLGIREQTIDIDIKLDPEPAGAFQAIAHLKDELEINVELASPDQFIPPLPGWRDRSVLIATEGGVQFRHYDFYAQALSKIERGYQQDMVDAEALARLGVIEVNRLSEYSNSLRSEMVRYPAIDVEAFESKVAEFVKNHENR